MAAQDTLSTDQMLLSVHDEAMIYSLQQNLSCNQLPNPECPLEVAGLFRIRRDDLPTSRQVRVLLKWGKSIQSP